jgi:hypothetical protein
LRRLKTILLIIVLVPIYLVAFAVVHELGHTVLARLFGDPGSTFYLVQIDPGGRGYCLGCNITDHTKISPFGNLAVSLGGILFTQVTALIALGMIRFTLPHTLGYRLFSIIALGFAFLDVPVQVAQGLLYNIERNTWPTGVDLMDAMFQISSATGAPPVMLKTILAILAGVYLYLFWRGYRRIQSRVRTVQDQLPL